MLFAADDLAKDASGVAFLVAVGGLVGGAVAWVYNAYRAKRGDAIVEWTRITDRLQTEIDGVQVRCRLLETQTTAALKAEADCREKLARQEGLISQMQSDVKRLQVLAHDTVPTVTVPCVISASADDGAIRACSPSSGPLFGWLPGELLGKNIEVLIPPELAGRHKAGLAAVAAGEKALAEPTVIRTTAMARDGRRIPVVISLASWKSPKGSVFVNAEIRPDVQDVKV